MKFANQFILFIVLAAALFLFAGCSSAKVSQSIATASVTPQETELATSAPAVSLQPTNASTPSPSPTPEPTLTPTAKSTPKVTSTPKATADSGKVVIAEGFYYIKLTDEIKKRITGMSYPSEGEDCEITYDDLRYIKLQYYDFDGSVHEGELIVHKKLAKEVTEIFYELYQAKYPFTSIRLVDDYGEPGDDNLSMAANNTSAFNYRYVTGTKKLSRHSYGAAIDINPMLNPYIDGDRVAPENGAKYVDRTLDLAGMIDHDDLCYQLFTEHGWSWGGDWSGDKDYQHFSKSIS